MRELKKFFGVVILVVISTNCVPSSGVVEVSENYPVYGYDFTTYSEEGFLFTTETYLGDYESVGLIEIPYRPEFIRAEVPRGTVPDQWEGYENYQDPFDENLYWRVKQADPDTLIKEAYEIADSMGADAIINFEISPYTVENGSLSVTSIRLTGFGIKRLD